MAFRFEITEVFPARRPIVCLIGWLREGHMSMSDLIAVPYTDGTTVQCAVVGIEALNNGVQYINAEGLEEQIGIAVNGLNALEIKKDSIAIGSEAVSIQRIPSSIQSDKEVENPDWTKQASSKRNFPLG